MNPADDTTAGEREGRAECGFDCDSPSRRATPDADDTPPPAAGDVEAADAKWALAFAIIRELPLSPDGTGHVVECGWDDVLGQCGCFTLPERIANLLKAHDAARDAVVAERIAQAIEDDFRNWQSLGGGRIEIPLHSTAWFVQRSYESAARIAREQAKGGDL